jgi:hypothetical protein
MRTWRETVNFLVLWFGSVGGLIILLLMLLGIRE